MGAATVLAHNVHPGDAELERLAHSRASVAHCPASNAFLGSGIFPMGRHLDHRVRFALGTDVGAGTGLGMLKEGLMAYQAQLLAPDGVRLSPVHLLWLVTRAGADSLGLGDITGDLTPGKEADYVLIRPRTGSALEATLERTESTEDALGALFALAREDSITEVRVAGERVGPEAADSPLHSPA